MCVYIYVYGRRQCTPLQYSCLENPVDGGAWQAAVHEVTKSRTRLNNFTLTFHFRALEKEMATHSSIVAWRIPGTGSLVGCRPWGLTESDTTEATQQHIYMTGRAFVWFRQYRNLPLMQEIWVHFLGREEPLEKGKAAHSSILACRIPWTEEPGRAIVHGVAKSRIHQSMHTHTILYNIIILYNREGLYIMCKFIF